MSVYFLLLFGFLFVWISRFIFVKWFNPLSFMTVVWVVIVSAYQLKLLNFFPLSSFTWLIILAGYFSFFIGCVTVYLWENRFNSYDNKSPEIKIDKILTYNDGKTIRNIIIVFSLLGLYGAIQHWMILLKTFGSIAGVLIHAAKVYHMRQTGEIKGIVPYVWLFSYFAAFFSGIYMAYKKKLSLIVLLPLIGIILKDMAKVARNGIIIGMLEFFISYFFFKFYLNKNEKKKNIAKQKRKIVSTLLIIVFFIAAISAVKLFRNPEENYVRAGTALSQFKGGVLISPHVYFYIASQVGVLNRYLENADENMPWGSSTFATFYNILSGLGLIEKVNWRQVGYHIPEWSNTATYLRDFYNDYGPAGIILGPYILAIFTTLLWFNFFRNGRISTFLLLVQMNVIIGLSFFILALRSPTITFFFFFVYPLILFLEKRVNENKQLSYNPQGLH